MRSLSSASKQSLLQVLTSAILLSACVAVLTAGILGALQAPARAAAPQIEPARIAVVDVQKVLTQSNIGKASVERLKKLQDERLAKAKEMDQEVRTLTEQASSTAITDARRDELTKQLTEKRTALQRFGQDAERELGTARDRELASLDAQVQPVLSAVSKEMGLSAVFNKFESGLVYASDSIDITDTVIQRLNQK